jgi:hypothetical protein
VRSVVRIELGEQRVKVNDEEFAHFVDRLRWRVRARRASPRVRKRRPSDAFDALCLLRIAFRLLQRCGK